MSGTLLRMGLWIILLVLACYVLRETYPDTPLESYLAPALLQRAGLLGLVVIGAGVLTSVFGKATRKLNRNYCVVCKTPIRPGGLYCPDHFRRVIEDEHDRTHGTKTRRAT